MNPNYMFWYGGYKVSDLQWLMKALTDLRRDSWKEDMPLYIDLGSGRWPHNVTAIREQAAVSLLKALANDSTKSVRSLIVRNGDMDVKVQEALLEVFEHNHTLQSIYLKDLRTTHGRRQGQLVIPPRLFQNSPCLTDLRLELSRMDKESCKALAELIRAEDCQLKTLTLYGITIICSTGDDESEGTAEADSTGLASLASAIAVSRSLRRLSLRKIRFASFEDDVEVPSPSSDFAKDVNLLLDAIGMNDSLKFVQMEDMELGTAHALHLGTMIGTNQHLEELQLEKNNLQGSCVERILLGGEGNGGLIRNNTLRSLSLSSNPVGDDGARHVVQAFRSNSTLHTLHLVDCEIWRRGCESIVLEGFPTWVGARNPCVGGLREITLDGNDIEECGQTILHVLQTNQTCSIFRMLNTLPRLIREEEAADDEGTSIWKRVDLLLRSNKANRRFLVQDTNEVCLPLLPAVLSGCRDDFTSSAVGSEECQGGPSRSRTTSATAPSSSSNEMEVDVLFEMLRLTVPLLY